MERKNIFRGKNKKNGWIYGDLIHNRGEVFIAPLGIANPFATAEDFIVDENSVGYFTSLKDKTNKDIYEGDIVSKYGELFICVWLDKYACFAFVESKGHGGYNYFQECDKDELKIVGNVYDNSELLNK
jgi:uncharacterized phage protein (TIGR01671 family)